jgi:predicted amidohydrolase YtcJ
VYGGDDGVRAAAPRIEHAQVLRPDLIDRMAALGVVACIQPCFAASDAASITSALAGRYPVAYRWDLLLDAGVRVIAGSDFPIETLDPTIGLERLTTGDHALSEDVAFGLLTTPLDHVWAR